MLRCTRSTHLLVDAVHHGGGRHVLRVASLLLGGRHLIGGGGLNVSVGGGGEGEGGGWKVKVRVKVRVGARLLA